MDAQHLTGWLREKWLDAYRALARAEHDLAMFADGGEIGTGDARLLGTEKRTEKSRDALDTRAIVG